LQIRLASGIKRSALTLAEESSLLTYLEDDHLMSAAWEQGSVVLSSKGRLIADRIVREILL
jgi:hypothetical protein